MKHLTKFEEIFHQKSPGRTVSRKKAQEIGNRLFKNRSNERSRQVLTSRGRNESTAEKEQRA